MSGKPDTHMEEGTKTKLGDRTRTGRNTLTPAEAQKVGAERDSKVIQKQPNKKTAPATSGPGKQPLLDRGPPMPPSKVAGEEEKKEDPPQVTGENNVSASKVVAASLEQMSFEPASSNVFGAPVENQFQQPPADGLQQQQQQHLADGLQKQQQQPSADELQQQQQQQPAQMTPQHVEQMGLLFEGNEYAADMDLIGIYLGHQPFYVEAGAENFTGPVSAGLFSTGPGKSVTLLDLERNEVQLTGECLHWDYAHILLRHLGECHRYIREVSARRVETDRVHKSHGYDMQQAAEDVAAAEKISEHRSRELEKEKQRARDIQLEYNDLEARYKTLEGEVKANQALANAGRVELGQLEPEAIQVVLDAHVKQIVENQRHNIRLLTEGSCHENITPIDVETSQLAIKVLDSLLKVDEGEHMWCGVCKMPGHQSGYCWLNAQAAKNSAAMHTALDGTKKFKDAWQDFRDCLKQNKTLLTLLAKQEALAKQKQAEIKHKVLLNKRAKLEGRKALPGFANFK